MNFRERPDIMLSACGIAFQHGGGGGEVSLFT